MGFGGVRATPNGDRIGRSEVRGVFTAVVSYVPPRTPTRRARNGGPRPRGYRTAWLPPKPERQSTTQRGYRLDRPGASGQQQPLVCRACPSGGASRGPARLCLGDGHQQLRRQCGASERRAPGQPASPWSRRQRPQRRDLDLGDRRGVPTALLDADWPVPGFHTIGPDFHDGARSVVEHLLTIHEARTVALVTGYLDFVEVNSRERGWQEALARHGLPEGPILEGPFTRDGDCSPCSAGCRGRWSGTGRPWSVGDGPGSRCSPRPATGSGGVLVSRVIIDADRRARHALRAVWGEYAEPGPVLGQGRAESAGGRAADSGPGTGRRQRGNATSASNQVRWSGRLGASRIVSARSASAGSARTGSGAGSGQSPRGQ